MNKRDKLNLSLPTLVSTPQKMANFLLARAAANDFRNCDYAELKERFINMIIKKLPPIDQLMDGEIKRQTHKLDTIEFYGLFKGSTLVLKAAGPTTNWATFTTAFTRSEVVALLEKRRRRLEAITGWREAISRGMRRNRAERTKKAEEDRAKATIPRDPPSLRDPPAYNPSNGGLQRLTKEEKLRLFYGQGGFALPGVYWKEHIRRVIRERRLVSEGARLNRLQWPAGEVTSERKERLKITNGAVAEVVSSREVEVLEVVEDEIQQ